MRSLDQLAAEEWPSEPARVAWTKGHGDAFAMLKAGNGVAWHAIEARFELAIAEANDTATHPDTDEAKRAGWAARERGLRDLHREFADLYSGAWKEWPEVQTKDKPAEKDAED